MSRLSDFLGYGLLAVGAWWLWNGPVQDMRGTSYEDQLALNEQRMAKCVYGEDYRANATGMSEGAPADICAQKLGLYLADGNWHRYDQARRVKLASN